MNEKIYYSAEDIAKMLGVSMGKSYKILREMNKELAGKGFLIVTSKPEEIAQKVSDDLGRGITFIRGMGYYSRKDLDIVYCVVSRNEMKQMKDIINQIDPFAFITISEAHEILGEGFTLDKEKQPINR